jgi:hypothetical protein
LIREVWRAGIGTLNSCQENRPGIIWIQFASADAAAAFLDIVTEYEEEADSLYNRITGRWDVPEHSAPAWEYHALPEDLGLVEMFTDDDEIDQWHEGEVEFLFTMSVRFPRSDFPAVLARMVRHNQERERLAHARDDDGTGVQTERPCHLRAEVAAEVLEGMAAKEGELAQAAAGGTLI